jgi:hypothetical protein
LVLPVDWRAVGVNNHKGDILEWHSVNA